jgi:protein-S-isoprenylcysteine O-methyltransferase Ste14
VPGVCLDCGRGKVGLVSRRSAALGSLVFTVAMPGVVAGLIPYALTGGWQSDAAPLALQIVGAVLLVAGLAVLALTIVRFVVEGVGTPCPVAPTKNLVVGGLYRYVRNPMYLGVLAIILGQAAILASVTLFAYAALVWVVVASFVRFYEEPTLLDEYGEQYVAYRRAVRAWLPRATPWSPQNQGG